MLSTGCFNLRIFFSFENYMKGVSKRIQKMCQWIGIKTVFSAKCKMRSLITRAKGKPPIEQVKSVVYEVPCECGERYMEETGRILEAKKKNTNMQHWHYMQINITTRSYGNTSRLLRGSPSGWRGRSRKLSTWRGLVPAWTWMVTTSTITSGTQLSPCDA